LLKLGVTVSERTVSRYLPDRLMAPSQTWRTFLANHLGDLAFTSTVTSSYAPGDDDDVDACLLPFRFRSVTPRAVHLNSVGGCRLASFAPTHVSGTACRPGSPSPPCTHTRQLQQGPAEVEGRRNWPQGVRASFLPSGDSIWPKANEQSQTIGSLGAGSPSAVLSLSMQSSRQRRRWAIPAPRARLRVILPTVGILARHTARIRPNPPSIG